MPCAQPSPRDVRQQAYVCPWGSLCTNEIQQLGDDGVTEPSTLVFGKDRHVDDVEAAAAVTDDSSHPDDLTRDLVTHTAGRPAAQDGDCRRFKGLR